MFWEIKNSGYENKLIAGIVLTGGGSQLKHLVQLTEFITGMDTRIGYPNEHLASGSPEELASPTYATGIGLVIEGFHRYEMESKKEKNNIKDDKSQEKPKTKKRFLDKIQDFFDQDSNDIS